MGKWAEPELTFGFMAACLPVLPAFIKHIFRTSLGRKIRALWTQSPLTERDAGSEGRQVQTIGSYGPAGGRSAEKREGITKCVEMDIEFAELTRESRDGTSHHGDEAGRSRDTSRERDEEWGVTSRDVKLESNAWPLRP
jgi:hypothetical protein